MTLAGLEAEAIVALNSDVLAVEVAPVVGFLGTAKCQQALVNLANQDQRELSQRQAAADGFEVRSGKSWTFADEGGHRRAI